MRDSSPSSREVHCSAVDDPGEPTTILFIYLLALYENHVTRLAILHLGVGERKLVLSTLILQIKVKPIEPQPCLHY